MEEKIRVLIIDDSPFIHKTIKKALADNEGIEVVGTAENGRIGLDMVESLKPDIVTLDVTMPVMDGLETAEEMAKTHPSVKVIMLSAMGDNDLVTKATSLGVKHFLTKPFESKDLQKAIFNVLREA
ncbi:two-component system, chemotaxis family, response regulator CheY [Dethiosulfovibrio salsuginis]|uniref:Two-component system, chemotaxis family, response regulator CheY n=1 Tax=Dethiosulfovibrio salsuginis TaxID=561720 RepID=A0A1X7J6S5_9BACT|nr:two-component system, chemotaxis family, response regulator CheY [Dethiosulfovibrio salsuginis]